MKKPDFQQHRQFKRGYKMLVRFVLYGLTVGFLVYLIQYKSKKSNTVNTKQIEQFVIEDTTTINL